MIARSLLAGAAVLFTSISCARAADGPRRHPTEPMPTIESFGPLRMAPQRPLPIGTEPTAYSNRDLREGKLRYIYNTPYYELWDTGCGGWGVGWGGFGVGGFGCGPATVGFATGGTGQGAY
ncbi:MAG: hypothetical protein JO353_03375 [Phycisphaerae bacterium]|nr:hypothetical protein [Phycisphaerae bacterium]